MGNRVFLSYSSKDKGFVRAFDSALRAFGVDTFLDERDIALGEDIPRRLSSELDRATHVLYFISSHSIQSPWVQKELSAAQVREMREKGILILPILIERLGTLPATVASKRYADFTDGTIDIAAANFQLVLEGLGVAGRATIDENLNATKTPVVRNIIAEVLLTSAELQVKLSDVSFLLHFATQAAVDSKSIRRLLETRKEIRYRQVDISLSRLLEELEKLSGMSMLQPYVRELRKTQRAFFDSQAEVENWQPTSRPDEEWLHQCAEAARLLQFRIGQIHELLLVFHLQRIEKPKGVARNE